MEYDCYTFGQLLIAAGIGFLVGGIILFFVGKAKGEQNASTLPTSTFIRPPQESADSTPMEVPTEVSSTKDDEDVEEPCVIELELEDGRHIRIESETSFNNFTDELHFFSAMWNDTGDIRVYEILDGEKKEIEVYNIDDSNYGISFHNVKKARYSNFSY